jgi:Staygreen protein
MESRVAPREVTLKPKAPPAALFQAAIVAKQALPIGHDSISLFEDRITVRDSSKDEELPRRYVLTHSDRAGDVFLTIGREYDHEALDQPQTRRMRDEVLAELTGGDQPQLKVTCLVSVEGLTGKEANPSLRRKVFEKEMPFVLAVIRYGDRFFYERHPDLDQAPAIVEFRSTDPKYQSSAEYGPVTDYRVTRIAGESRRLMVGAAALAAFGIGALVVGMRRK